MTTATTTLFVTRHSSLPLALTLLVRRILAANHPDNPAALDHLAGVATLLHRSLNLHSLPLVRPRSWLLSFAAHFRHDTPSPGIEGREFQPHPIARQESHDDQSQSTAYVGENISTIIERNSEERIR